MRVCVCGCYLLGGDVGTIVAGVWRVACGVWRVVCVGSWLGMCMMGALRNSILFFINYALVVVRPFFIVFRTNFQYVMLS